MCLRWSTTGSRWKLRDKLLCVIDVGELWRRVQAHEGEVFRQLRGKEFTYTTTPKVLRPSTTNWQIPRNHFAEAIRLVPLANTVPVQHLYAPSYLYAILMDSRVRGGDW